MAGVLEMLVQSHGGFIRILPALPEQWRDGQCRGIRCRGGLALDLTWRDGVVTELTVHRISGDPDQLVTIRYCATVRNIRVAPGHPARLTRRLQDVPC